MATGERFDIITCSENIDLAKYGLEGLLKCTGCDKTEWLHNGSGKCYVEKTVALPKSKFEVPVLLESMNTSNMIRY